MSMRDLEAALELVARNPQHSDFVGKRDPTLVAAAESALRLTLPPTYRKFVGEVGAGYFGGEEFYGIVGDDFLNSSVPNGIWLTLDERDKFHLPPHLIIVSETGDGSWYALDTSKRSENGENPVVLWTTGLSEIGEEVARDFGEFFYATIQDALVRSGSPK